MTDAGILTKDDRVQLLDGEIVQMAPMKGPHATALSLTGEALRPIIGDDMHVRVQLPISIGERPDPEPDVAVVRGAIRDFATDHPQTAELVVEVADPALALDRGLKAALYAAAKVPDYWVVDLADRSVER
ncbi:MAG: Uma2 family endonuclease [Chloroflexi bacterium]|nr:Uma2 family endonuclease [Chloroflexota bacterium]